MSRFADDLKSRILMLNKMIESAPISERRKLQKERAELEAKLRKVSQ